MFESLSLGERLALLRKQKGVLQKQVAEYLNVSDKTVSKWENGETEPNLDIINNLSTYYGCSLDFIIKGEVKAEDKNIASEIEKSIKIEKNR